ncbi:MAG TPA: ABC transporter permease [Acidimicrobiales bacterium]|nr:ABC transporter permease [Acidimicrobiales bacterium]
MGGVGAVWLHMRTDLRRQWRSWSVLALLVALSGGAAIALAAGARRTDSAYQRFLHAQRAPDLYVYLTGGLHDDGLIGRMPDVVETSTEQLLAPTQPGVVPLVLPGGRQPPLNRPRLLAGRLPRAGSADEIAVGFLFARQRHLHVGSRLVLHLPPGGPVPSVPMHVVGIEALPGEFPPMSAGALPAAFVSPAFAGGPTALPLTGDGAGERVSVRLRHGARASQMFEANLQRAVAVPVGTSLLATQTAPIERSFHFQAMALWLTAAVVGLVAALVLAQLLARRAAVEATELAVWRALGMTSGQLAASSAVRVGAMAVAGAAGAALFSVLSSPLFPLGTVRAAEPRPGLSVDVLAVGSGAAGAALLVTALGVGVGVRVLAGAGRRASEAAAGNRRSHLVRAATDAGLPLVLTTGLRLALERGRGRTAVPVRATVLAAAVAIGALATAATFSSSLGRLLATPSLYGITFDAHARQVGDFADARPVAAALRRDRAVASAVVAETGVPMTSGHTNFDALALFDGGPRSAVAVVGGRRPERADEIALGAQTLADLHVHLGQTVPLAVQGVTGPRTMRVVGQAVLPALSEREQLGRGGVVTREGLDAFLDAARPGFEAPPPGDVFVRFRPGAPRAQAIARLQDTLGRSLGFTIREPETPTDVVNFGEVRSLPQVLAGLTAVVGVVTLAYLLVTVTRRRRRELAVLKSLGLVTRQVSWVIGWQATTIVLAALLVGVPAGIVAGWWAWGLIAGQVGVVVRPAVPWAAVAVLVAGAVAVANAVAAGPALAAARIRPADVLRSE